MLTKSPNFGIFSDTSGRITKTYQINQPRVYSIFYSDDLLDIQNDQLAYRKVRDSCLCTIVARPAILPYVDTIKWIVDHANPKDQFFNGSAGSQVATFHPDVFTRAYALKPVVQPLNAEFSQPSQTQYNFNKNMKSSMNEPINFSQRDENLYSVSQLREPYSLLVGMRCRLYALPNYFLFKV